VEPVAGARDPHGPGAGRRGPTRRAESAVAVQRQLDRLAAHADVEVLAAHQALQADGVGVGVFPGLRLVAAAVCGQRITVSPAG